jgi:hypothetical protein
MAQDASRIRVFSGGDLYVAPYGTPLPESTDDALDPAFQAVGFVTSDGVTFTSGSEVEDITSWQSSTPTRRVVVSRSYAVAAQLQQQDDINYATAFGGGDWTEPSPGVFRYDPPADTDALAEYSLVADGHDGDVHQRAVVLRATVEGEVETTWVRNGAAILPLTFTALTPDDADRPWYFLTNDPAFDPAAS